MIATPLETNPNLTELIIFCRDWHQQSTGLKSGLQSKFNEIMSDLVSDKKALIIYEDWLFNQTESTYFLISSRLLFAAVIYRQQQNDDGRQRVMMKLAKEERKYFNSLLNESRCASM